MPLHKILRGSIASKYLPFAKGRLKRLKHRRHGGAVLQDHVKGLPDGAEILVKTTRSQDFIQITAGEHEFIITQNLEKNGVYISRTRFWLYNPTNHFLKKIHEEEYTGTVLDENLNTIGSWDWKNGDDAIGSVLGIGFGRYREGFLHVLGFNPRSGLTYDYPYGTLWETEFSEDLPELLADEERKYMPEVFTNSVNMAAPYTIAFGITDNLLDVTDESLYSIIRQEFDEFDVLGNEILKPVEYAIALRQVPSGDKEEFIVKRDVGRETNWTFEYLLGRHGSSVFGIALDEDYFTYTSATGGAFSTDHVHIKSIHQHYNDTPPDTTHTFTERVWEYNYDTIVLKFEWIWQTFTTPLVKQLDNFLDDEDSDLVGGVYSYIALADHDSNPLASPIAKLDFFSTLKETGIENAPIIFSIDAQILFDTAPTNNYKFNCNRFWVVEKRIVDENGVKIDKSVYGVLIVGSGAPENYPSLVGRWDEENGFEIIFENAAPPTNVAISGRWALITNLGIIVDMLKKKYKSLATAKNYPEPEDNPFGLLRSVFPKITKRA